MRIDSHQHFWRFDPIRHAWIDSSMQKIATDFLPKDLVILLEQNQMDGCVAVQADQSEIETKFLLDLIDSLIGFPVLYIFFEGKYFSILS